MLILLFESKQSEQQQQKNNNNNRKQNNKNDGDKNGCKINIGEQYSNIGSRCLCVVNGL